MESKCGPDLILNDIEAEKFNRYQCQKPTPYLVPAFWESRCWDTPSKIMSLNDSESLKKQILNSMYPKPPTKTCSSGAIRKKPAPSKKTKEKKRCTSSTRIRLSNVYFLTDESADETDLEEEF